jgi:hypothetical protein
MSQTATNPKMITPMDESHRNDEDLTWSRFWLGIAGVIVFMIASILLVIAIGGTRAGADYGLLVLIVTLLAGIADGVVLIRRRRHR